MCTLTIETSQPLPPLHSQDVGSWTYMVSRMVTEASFISGESEQPKTKKPGAIHTIGISRKCPGWLLLWTSPTMDVEFPECHQLSGQADNMSKQAEIARSLSIKGRQTSRDRQKFQKFEHERQTAKQNQVANKQKKAIWRKQRQCREDGKQ